MKKLTLLFLLAGCSALFAQTASVSGHLFDGSTSPQSTASISFTLVNTGGNVCKVSGTAIVVQSPVTFNANGSGAISGTLYRNDFISCGGVSNSVWQYQVAVNGQIQPTCMLATLATSSLNVDNAACSNTVPVITPPTGDTTYCRLDGSNCGFTGNISGQSATFAGSATITGALTAQSVNGVVYCDNQTGADIGAKCNAAFATLSGSYGTVRISAPGSYSFSTTIAFTSPAVLECAPGVILNYTGSGKAINMGTAGASFNFNQPAYGVRGCTIKGGASWTHGIYFNTYVTESIVDSVHFTDAGNTTGWNIEYQSFNFQNLIVNTTMETTTSGCFNGVLVNGYNTDNVTTDFGVSFVQIVNSHLQPAAGCTTTGIIAGGRTYISGGNIANFSPLIRVRYYGANTTITGNIDLEIIDTTSGACAIMYGDKSTDPGAQLGNYIDELTIRDTLINVHNSSVSTTATPLCPTQGSTGLQNALLDNVTVGDITGSRKVVVQNNIINQNGNRAYNTHYNGTNGIPSTGTSLFLKGNLHTTGGNIANWDGTDGDVFSTFGALNIGTYGQTNGFQTLSPSGAATSFLANCVTDSECGLGIQNGKTAEQDSDLWFFDNAGNLTARIQKKSAAHGQGLNFINNGNTGLQINASGILSGVDTLATAGLGVPVTLGVTSQKSETGSADANVLTVTPAAAVGTYRACVVVSVSAATSGVISWTLSWTDSNSTAQSNVAQDLFQQGTSAPATSFTTSAAGNYNGCTTFDVNNAGSNIVIKWVGGGTTTAKASATIERLQ